LRNFIRGEANDITLYTITRRHVEVGKTASFRSPFFYSVTKKVVRGKHKPAYIDVLIAHSMPKVKTDTNIIIVIYNMALEDLQLWFSL